MSRKKIVKTVGDEIGINFLVIEDKAMRVEKDEKSVSTRAIVIRKKGNNIYKSFWFGNHFFEVRSFLWYML